MGTAEFIGKTESQARFLALQSGLRVVVKNAVPTMLTNAMQMDRVTLEVNDGCVTNAWIG